MRTWTGNILQSYKVYKEEHVRILNSEIDCRMRMNDNLQYQSIVRFEQIASGRFSPADSALSPLRSPSRRIFFQVPLRSRSSGFRARSATFSAPAPLTCCAIHIPNLKLPALPVSNLYKGFLNLKIWPWTLTKSLLGEFYHAWDGTCQGLSVHQIWNF